MNARACSSSNQLSKSPKPHALKMLQLALPRRSGAPNKNSSRTKSTSCNSPTRSGNVTPRAPSDESELSRSTLVASTVLALVEQPQPRLSIQTRSTWLYARTFGTRKPNTTSYSRGVTIDTRLGGQSPRLSTKSPVDGLVDRQVAETRGPTCAIRPFSKVGRHLSAFMRLKRSRATVAGSEMFLSHVVSPGCRARKVIGRPRTRLALELAWLSALLAGVCATAGVSGGEPLVLPLLEVSAFGVLLAGLLRLCEKPRRIVVREREPTSFGPVIHFVDRRP